MERTVLFDLNGTLLPMDQEQFTRAYFRLLTERVAPLGYAPEKLVASVWAGTAAMVENDGSRTNFDAFWTRFERDFGLRARKDLPVFDDFYLTDFHRAREVCGFQPMAGEAVSFLKSRGCRLVLASNPVFPRSAQEARMRWAGVDPADFSYITSYENSRFSKPSPEYFREIAEVLSLDPALCLMVGNDTREDVAAAKAGMKVFLVTDCLIDRDGVDLSDIPHGGYPELMRCLEEFTA